jgi:hypothetical protein
MHTSIRLKRRLVIAALVVFFSAVVLVILPSALINSPRATSFLRQRLADTLEADVDFERIRLTLVPHVQAAIERPRARRAGRYDIQASQLSIGLRLPSLLHGELVPTSLRVEAPRVRLPLEAAGVASAAGGSPDPHRLLKLAAGRLRTLPALDIEITDAAVVLTGPEGPAIEFNGVGVTLRHHDGVLSWQARGGGNYLKAVSSRGALETGTFKGTADLGLVDLRLPPQLRQALAGSGTAIGEAAADLDIHAELDGDERLNARLQGRLPALVLERHGRKCRLAIERVRADIALAGKTFELTVPELVATSPRAAAELRIRVDPDAHPAIDIALTGRNADAAGVRAVALPLLGELDAVRAVFDILRAGTASWITVELHGERWGDLSDLKNLLIRGRLEQGEIHVPAVGLDLDAVEGDAVIAEGVLEGRQLKAHYRGTFGQDGFLRVGLTPADPVLQLSIFMQAELRELPPVLERLVRNEAFQRELKQVNDFSGTAEGTLRLSGTHSDMSVSIDASHLAVRGRHERVPYPIEFSGGVFCYEHNAVRLSAVDVTVGRSRIARADVDLDLSAQGKIAASSPEAVLDLEEVFGALRTLPPFAALRSAAGRAVYGPWQLSGSALRPDTWQFRSRGTLRDVRVEWESPPAALRIDSGAFDWSDTALHLSGALALFGDSAITGFACDLDWGMAPLLNLRAGEAAIRLEDLGVLLAAQPAPGIHAGFLAGLSGTVRAHDVTSRVAFAHGAAPRLEFDAGLQSARIASPAFPRPIELDSGRVAWKGARLKLEGVNAAWGASTVRGLRVGADLGAGAGEWTGTVESGSIRTEELYESLKGISALKALREDIAGIRGTVGISGLKVTRPVDSPHHWRIQASAELSDVEVETPRLAHTLRIPSGRLTVEEAPAPASSTVRLSGMHLESGESLAVVDGTATLAPGRIGLDLDAAAQGLAWEEIRELIEHARTSDRPQNLSFTGQIRLRAERFDYERFHAEPFFVNVDFDPQGPVLGIENASLCGIRLIGRLAFSDGQVHLFLVPLADGMQLDGVADCLTEHRSFATGSFNLDGSLQADAPPDKLRESLSGRITFIAEKGRVTRSTVLGSILSILNLTEIYRGTVPDMSGEGIAYDRMHIDAEFKQGKLLIHRYAINGPSLWMGSRGEIDLQSGQIQLTALVSPFKTFDRILNQIPVIRTIFGGRLVAIPVEVSGDLSDPRVVPMHPAAIGTGLLEMLGRTLMLPVTIIQPLLPEAEQQQTNDDATIIKRK